jgi:hypothetical protein
MPQQQVSQQLSWGNIIATLGLIGTVMAGEYFILSSYIEASTRNADTRFNLTSDQIKELRDESRRVDERIQKQLDYIQTTRVAVGKFEAFEKRVDQYMATPFLRADAFNAWETERNKLIDQLISRIKTVEDDKRK